MISPGEVAAPAAESVAPSAESAAPPAPSSTAAQPARPNPHLWRAFLAFLLPMMASNILQALSGTINNVYLGQMLGVRAMAAVSAFFPILFFFISFMIGLGSGASVLIGQAWGARETERVKAVAGTTLTVGLIVGLLVALFGGVLTGPMLRLLHTPADILPETTAYARIMLIAAPGIFVYLLVTSMLRGVSDTVSPLITLAVSTAIGLVVTPALIRGWGGLPQMGVASGAWAATASYVVGMGWLAWHMLRRNHPLAPDAVFLRHMKIDRAILARVLRIGLPTAMQVITMSLAEVAVLFLVNRFGSDATAAYGAVNQVMSYVQFPAMSIAITASILGAQAIGAGRTGTLGAIARTGILMNLVLTGSLVLLAYLFSRSLIGLFITSAPVVEITQTLLHIMLWSLVVYGMAAVLSGLMRASGTVLVPTGISIFCILAVEIPVAWGMSHLIGLDGVWIGYPAAFIAMLLLQTGYYRLVWRKRPIRRL